MLDNSILTLEDRVALLVNALASDRDHRPVVKLFAPDAAATWLLRIHIRPEVENFRINMER